MSWSGGRLSEHDQAPTRASAVSKRLSSVAGLMSASLWPDSKPFLRRVIGVQGSRIHPRLCVTGTASAAAARMRGSRQALRHCGRRRARLILTTAISLWLTGSSKSHGQDLPRTQFNGATILAIVVNGLQHIREQVVLEQLDVRVGDKFEDELIQRNIQRLDRLGVFSRIDIDATPETGGVRLTVSVAETLRVLPAVSIGVSDADGVSAGPTVRLLSIRGRPHEISMTARFGGSTLVEFKETSPYLYSRRLWHSVRGTFEDRQNTLDDFGQQSVEVDGQIGARFSARSKIGAWFNLYTVSSDVPGKTLSSSDRDWFIGSGALYEYDTRDLPTNPTRGWWNSADFLWRAGSGSYVTMNLDARRYQPIVDRQTLVLSSLLTLQTGTLGQDVPIYGDYSLGGENTIRGWPFGSRRGKNQFINTVEYRYVLVPTRNLRVFGINLYGGLAAAVFGDLGAVWSDPDELLDRFIGGGGIGLRIVFPFVNLVRLDLAFGQPNGNPLFQLGVNEKFVAQRNRVR
jgi:outer membrane protein assembly factor BamA